TELGDHHVGPERREERRHHLLERRQENGRVGERLERQIHRVADALARSRLVDEAGAREKIFTALVRRNGHHQRITVETVLHALPILPLDVPLHHPPPFLPPPPNR